MHVSYNTHQAYSLFDTWVTGIYIEEEKHSSRIIKRKKWKE